MLLTDNVVANKLIGRRQEIHQKQTRVLELFSVGQRSIAVDMDRPREQCCDTAGLTNIPESSRKFQCIRWLKSFKKCFTFFYQKHFLKWLHLQISISVSKTFTSMERCNPGWGWINELYPEIESRINQFSLYCWLLFLSTLLFEDHLFFFLLWASLYILGMCAIMHMCVIILSLCSDFLFSLGVINPHDLPIYSGYHLPPLMRLHSLFPSPPRMNLLLPILACLKGEVFEVSWFPPFLSWFLVTAYKRYALLGITAFLLSPPTVNHTFSSVFYPLKPCSTVFKLYHIFSTITCQK